MVARQTSAKQAPGAEGGPVYVYIWFDIEDYVTEESDDLPLVAASILEKYGAKATCKMVAEKVRVLLERERKDVISAIAHHDVGYHLDTHSRHPTVYEYLADEDTLDGAGEFVRKESQGLALVEKTFKRRASCYGHPGPAWASHYYPAMKEMGIPVYLDETPILNVSNGPYWYCGILNLNGANENFVKFDYTFESPEGLQRLKAQFREIHERLAGEGVGGSVSFLFHLHTAINKEFWDAVNFARGQNRAREEYVRPPAQPREVTERAWRDLDAMMAYMSSFEDVRFITATDALTLFRTSRPVYDRGMLESALKELDGGEVRYVEVGDDFASPSELLYLIVNGIASISRTGRFEPITAKEPLGPEVARDLPQPPRSVKAKDLVAASTRLAAELDRTERLPATVDLGGGTSLSIADFMVSAARLLGPMLAKEPMPPEIGVARARFAQSEFVRPEEFEKACRWVVLPEGFFAPRILEEILQQTWTLRPAVMARPGTQGRRASAAEVLSRPRELTGSRSHRR